uniref:GATA-type domain-containing protein n=1 Tax=Brassica campestris TaxID=3711 RepID=A0A3P5ZWV4_BRACM|nr:unnamed protein product [Brassica rapa]
MLWALHETLGRRWGCSGACTAGRRIEMRKCTNMNCKAINTPMWRKGPLGPKASSLSNLKIFDLLTKFE